MTKPEGWEDEECSTLQTKAVMRGGRLCHISCWELTPEELKEIAETGQIWLLVVGGHPPLCIMGEKPDFPEWEKAEEAQRQLPLGD